MRAPIQKLNAAHAFQSSARSHVGCVRALNEDAILDRPDIGLWAVADGMGGHNAGEIASAVVIEELSHGTNVTEHLQRANRRLLAHAAQTRSGAIGSTVVVLRIEPTRFSCFWAGDSRAYLLRDDRLMRLTHDHSAVQELVDAGRITPTEAVHHPQAHVITRAVGAEQTLSVDCRDGPISASDTFLLCSDGLSNLIRDSELADAAKMTDLDAAADALLTLALQRNAPDNVSVILVRAP